MPPRRESAKNESIEQYFSTLFSTSDQGVGVDIKLHFLQHLATLYPEKSALVRESQAVLPLIRNTCKWLGQVHAEAYQKADQKFNAKDPEFPRIFFERLNNLTRGQYEPNTEFIVLRLQELLTYIEIMRVSHSLEAEVAAEAQVLSTIHEEMAHFFQMHDPSYRPLLSTYGFGWDLLPPEERYVAYLSHPIERDAKLFAAYAVIEDFEQRAKALLHTENEDEMRRRAYMEQEIGKMKEWANYLASL